MYSNQEIIAIFTKDTLLCATHAMQLMAYQTGKYMWSKEQWAELYNRYSELISEECIDIYFSRTTKY